MSLLWFGKRASDLNKRRKFQIKCDRCGQWYSKTEPECPHCSALTDQQLEDALANRARFRTGLGKGMLVAALIIIVLLVFI